MADKNIVFSPVLDRLLEEGVGYEVDKLRRSHDIVIVDTPPKADSDLRPALRAADLILVPLSASLSFQQQMDRIRSAFQSARS